MRSIVMMTGMVLGVVAFLAFIGAAATLAAVNPDACAFVEDVTARYDAATGALALVEQRSGETVRVIEAALEVTQIVGWSPDCRYLVGVVGPVSRADVPEETLTEPVGWYLSLVNDVVIWDVTSGARAATFEVPYHRFDAPQIAWSAAGDQLTVRTGEGEIVWQPGGEADMVRR